MAGFGSALAQAAARGGKMWIYIYTVLQWIEDAEVRMWTFCDMLINLMRTAVMQQAVKNIQMVPNCDDAKRI
jgi:hypothetical protein